MAKSTLTRDRIDRILKLCRTPAASSHACDLVYGISRSVTSYWHQTALIYLSNALNEHRHARLAQMRGDFAAARAHIETRELEIHYALRAAERSVESSGGAL